MITVDGIEAMRPDIDLAIVRFGYLVIYKNGQEVARFKRDLFPQMICDMARELRFPTPYSDDPSLPLG
jgi:hypothetical protein